MVVVAACVALLCLLAIGCRAAASARISVSISQRAVYAAESASLQLSCDFTTEPDYVFWYYSSYEGSSDRTSMIRCFNGLNLCALTGGFTNWTNTAATANGTLAISGVARQQDGYYECEGFSDASFARAGARVFVVAHGTLPSITASPSAPASGELVTLTCLTAGWNPPVNLTWSKTPVGSSVPVSITAGIVSAPPAGKYGASSSSATLTVTPGDDESVFSCSAAQQGTGEVIAGRVTIRVEHKPTPTPMPDLVAIEGTPVSVTCQANGYPIPRLQLVAANGTVVQDSPATSSSSGVSGSSTIIAVFALALPDRSQAGGYACRADNSRGSATAPFHLDVLFPPTVRAPPAVTVREGDAARLTCNVSGNPRPSGVQWRHMVTGEVRLNSTGTDLSLASAQRQLSGEWRCEVRAILTASAGPSIEFSASASVQLTVQYRPGAPTVLQPSQPSLAGGRVNLTCIANPDAPGEPPPSLRWSRSPSSDSSGSGGGSSNLVIDRVALGDSGLYYCLAANSLGGSQSIPVSLRVEQPPLAASVVTASAPGGRPIRARAGDGNFSLACGITAHPRPQIRWRRAGAGSGANSSQTLPTDSGPLFSAQYEISTEPFRYTSTLFFRGSLRSAVLLNDTGSFICEAINSLGAVQLTFEVVVEVPPMITNELDKVAIATERQLTCQFVSHSPATVTWSGPDGSTLPGNSSTPSDQLPWQFANSLVGPGAPGNYTCMVNNSLGRDSRTFRLTLESPPDPPLSAAIQATGWDRIQLVWKPGFDGGRPARLRVTITGWNASVGRSATVVMETDASQGQLLVTQLYPDTAYLVSLTPMNQLGQGPAYSGAGAPLAATTAHLKLPQPQGARWNAATSVLTFDVPVACPGCALCARLQESRDGGDTWAGVGDCRPYDPAGGPPRLGLSDPGSLYRVFLCLVDRPDVCGAPYTTYTAANLAAVSLIAIIVVTCVCAVIVASLAAALICLCLRRQTASRAGKSRQLAIEAPLAAPSASGLATAPASIRQSHGLLPQQRQHLPTAIAFVSPATTERSSNQTQETCLDGGSSNLSCTNGSCASPPQSGSLSLGGARSIQQQQLVCHGVIYGSDITDTSNCCYDSSYSPPPAHRKVIYEVVV